jgi:hypothetical protein
MQILTLYVNIIMKCTPTNLIEDEKSSQFLLRLFYLNFQVFFLRIFYFILNNNRENWPNS